LEELKKQDTGVSEVHLNDVSLSFPLYKRKFLTLFYARPISKYKLTNGLIFVNAAKKCIRYPGYRRICYRARG